jgi:hypothetical protein
MGFYGVYQVARGAAERGSDEAFRNGSLVIELEHRLGLRFEPALQRVIEGSSWLIQATSYTYWLSQFAVVGLTLLYVYFRHHDRFAGFRNWLVSANLIGLVGYIVMPTAPPRMFPEWGFGDTLASFSGLTHQSLGLLANPFAAMPSLHSMDAFIVGVVMASVCTSRVVRTLWLAWPVWVWLSVMGTGNHYWLDCAAGVAIAVASDQLLLRDRGFRRQLEPARA